MPITKENYQTIVNHAEMLGIPVTKGWNNFTQDYPAANTIVLAINNVAELQAMMMCVYRLNKDKKADDLITLRAAAGGRDEKYSQSFSFTDCAKADVIVHLVGNEFRRIESLGATTIRAGASVQIGELDKTLYEEHDLALPTSSLIPYVTVAGLSANAGHGTGQHQPSFAGLITKMRLCLPNGELATIDQQHPDFDVIRGAHLGLFGIVLDVELQCVPAKKLKCTMDVNTIDEFIQKTKQGLFKQYPYVSAMYVPTYYEDERTRKYNNVIVYIWEPVDKATPDINNHAEWLSFSQKIMIGLTEGLNIMGLLRTFPSLVPHYMRYFVSKLEVGKEDTVAIGPWHEIAHYQTAFPTDLHEYGALFPVDDKTRDGIETPEIVDAFEKLIATLTALAKEGKYPIAYAAYLRYFQGTNGGLSISRHDNNQHVCGMDMTTGQHFSGFDDFQKIMSDYCMQTLHAKPHWGKNAPAMDFSAVYGDDFTAFKNALNRWYGEHNIRFAQSPLINDFAAHLLGLPQARHALQAPPAEMKAATCSPDEAQHICATLLERISEETPEAIALRRELTRIAGLGHQHGVFGRLFNLCPTWSVTDTSPEKQVRSLP